MKNRVVVAKRVTGLGQTEAEQRKHENADRKELLTKRRANARSRSERQRRQKKTTGNTASWARVRAASAANATKTSCERRLGSARATVAAATAASTSGYANGSEVTNDA